MRKFASIALAIGALTVAALPAQAEDQSVYFATGAIGGRDATWPGPQAYGRYPYRGYGYGSGPYAYDEYAPEAYVGSPYGGYGGYPNGGYSYRGYGQQNCTYVGGPKGNWTCW
jgi:hypothetical protein